ncbi:hypothetical protein QAD02_010602 [Eretmocerus hayati]|uniref:Uncharacterized protein n=1 Tax=Eretmocerus hayati TaxID=131215 RepID=A0ACC2NW39_9HYME|nr:hypothetical protein QAD02_010602 [Eretmocerus hayati]
MGQFEEYYCKLPRTLLRVSAALPDQPTRIRRIGVLVFVSISLSVVLPMVLHIILDDTGFEIFVENVAVSCLAITGVITYIITYAKRSQVFASIRRCLQIQF